MAILNTTSLGKDVAYINTVVIVLNESTYGRLYCAIIFFYIFFLIHICLVNQMDICMNMLFVSVFHLK